MTPTPKSDTFDRAAMAIERRRGQEAQFDRAFDRLASAEGFLTTAANTLEQLGAEDLAAEARQALYTVRGVSNGLMKLEEDREDR